ncbi:hypothetical protein PLICRDRAFT_50369 [Plicaturopsis crispa FD-325 SS-3]|nr:hypothetical protein PLICRDRAFT_50369 [Plicaturopsis crispa FD-325 SS-3]
MSPLFPPLRRTLLERQLVRRQENSTDDSLTSRGRRVSARVQAGPSSASSGTIPRIRQRLFDRTQQIARDLEGIADRLAEREQGEHTPRPPRAALPADDPIPALIEDTQMMPPLPPIYFDHPPSHARAIDSAAERRFRAAVWQASMPPPSTDERPILVDTTDRHASRRRDAQRFRNRRAAVFEITEANPDVQRSQTSSEWLLSSSQATEEDVPGESGHDVGTQANGPAENNEYSSQSFDDLDHTALEWLMNPLPLPRPHNPPHIARPTRIRVPHAGSARRPDTSGSEDTYVSDAGVTRQRRGWARLDRDGNEIPADEEAQLEGARARARMQALSEGRLTQSLSPHGGEMDPVRPPRREFRPTTRSSMVDSTRQPDVVRVRINSWRSARLPSSDEAAAMMAAAFASSETHSSAPREPINPLPMPLDAMVLSPRVPDPPRAIVVHEHSNFAGR